MKMHLFGVAVALTALGAQARRLCERLARGAGEGGEPDHRNR